ncbi:MAG: PilC/PilY family type IV pilus protein [Desulfomonilaceae bacterium]|nr:PilC/PilY family type IV pilus protein [Desulfomonilaceae bacterium]
MKIRYLAPVVIGVFVLLLVTVQAPLPAHARSCSPPPFISLGGSDTTQNNLLFILDNSGSMNEFAYKENTGGRLSVTAATVYSTEVSWTGICQNQPACSVQTSNRNCRRVDDCLDRFYWSLEGNSGYCEYLYECNWSGGQCQRRAVSGYPRCVKTSGGDDMTYSCDGNGNCLVTVSDASSESVTAAYGFKPGSKYYGLFDSTKLYKYDNVNHFFYTGDGPEWTGVGPGNLAACQSGGPCPGSDKFSGNFLNWVTTRRIDVAKKVLTGGRLGGDKSYWVLVGSPMDREYAKLFDDRGSDGYYYTPFHTGLGVRLSTEDSVFQRTPPGTGDPEQGNFVPLMTFFEVTFSYGGSRGTTANPARNLSKEAGGETSGQGRDYEGSYYLAVKVGEIAAGDEAPQGVVQKFMDQMRMGYMHFNYGQGPAEGYPYTLGYGGTSWDINGDGVVNVVERRADGGRVINRVGDTTQRDSRQHEEGDPAKDRLKIGSIVLNINETHAATWTPLAETLREAMNYFQQSDPSYAWVDKNGTVRPNYFLGTAPPTNPADPRYNPDDPDPREWDPYFYDGALQPCTNSYIIFVSDGEPTQDNPCKSGCKTLGSYSCSRNECADISETMRFNGSGYLDDIAYKMHTRDMRPELGDALDKKDQTIELYTIYAFGRDASTRDILERAALQGGFVDKPFTAGKDGQAGYAASGLTSNWRDTYPCVPPQTTGCRTDGYTGYLEWDSNTDGTADHFFIASNDESFGDEVEKFITAVITHLVAAGSAAAVATISQETSDGDVIVRGAFTAADPDDDSRAVWHGHLEAYWPTDETAEGNPENYYEFDYPQNEKVFCGDLQITHASKLGQPAPSCWDAADNFSRDKRGTLGRGEIFTVVDGVQTDFHIDEIDDGSGNASGLRRLMRYVDDEGWPELPSANEAKAVIQWVRGEVDDNGQPSYGAAAGKIYRNRKGARLGDIVYSTPVIVGPPSLANVPRSDPNYLEFLRYRAYHSAPPGSTHIDPYPVSASAPVNRRAKVGYVGANDGMVHAFLMAVWDDTHNRWDYKCENYPYIDFDSNKDGRSSVSCGDHLWAFIPGNMAGELMNLCNTNYGDTSGGACMHRTMVDLSPKAYDVYIDPDGSGDEPRQWRTVIVGGQRGGGDTYFALDVTNPYRPKVLWQHSMTDNLPVIYEDSGMNKMVLPFRKNFVAQDFNGDGTTDYYEDDVHFNLKTLPMSWTYAAVGRLKFPTPSQDANFGFWYYHNPGGNAASFVYPSGLPAAPTLAKVTFPTTESDPYANLRHVAFIGSGFRLFDTASISAPSPDNTTIRKALQKPYLLAIDIETGVNYFQVLWPLLVKARSDGSKLPEEPISIDGVTKTIPWAFGDPTVVDVWDDANSRFGEDAFVDHLYMGDMRGFLYKIQFDFSGESSKTKGLAIDFWKTKFIPKVGAPDPLSASGNCDETNYFRGCRQPITVAPAVSVDSSTVYTNYPSLRLLFGTGKFDDVISAGYDDLTDKVKMSFYNASDPITAAPDLASSVGFEVVPRSGTQTYDRVNLSGTGSDRWFGFNVSGTNVGVSYGTGFCGDVEDLTRDNNYCQLYGCTPMAETPCRNTEQAPVQEMVCGGIADPTDQQKCRDECVEITRDPGCCNWLRDCDKGETSFDCSKGFIPDTCEGDCANNHVLSVGDTPCWKCVFDFSSDSERVIGRAALLGGYVFFTTYVPSKKVTTTGCTTTSAGVGSGFLYIFDYRCRPFSDNPLPTLGSEGGGGYLTTQGSGNVNPLFYGGKFGLGEGMPSQPVLDSKGQSVIVQKSDAALQRIKVDPLGGGKVDGDIAGWTER